MTDDASRAEFLSLVEGLGDQLSYLRELGVEGIEAGDFAATPIRAADEENAPERKSPAAAPPASDSRALRRNAEAESRRPPVESRGAPPTPTARVEPSHPPARREPTNVLYQTATEQKDMATRKPVRKPSANPPAPRETLFGEITPQDELSLPRPGETLESIREDIGDCMRCPLCCEARHTIVHSEGNPKARLMFVGEAPGADEDASGRPFVGRAGQLLNKIIEAIGLKREDVFIGNVNRCRPLNNRTPTTAEAATCKPFLLREIAIVRPEVIVVLGNTAMRNLLDTKEGITKARGKFQDYKGVKVMPTFHPAYLLRDPSKKRETWEDMKLIRDYLAKSKPER
ncbi:MAG: uracil-DNA glycosylase [Acidobacteria bacterium]|nr:uracil-DNA glycosylase [Acidobacteriota bacterium]MCA1642821.1 uracil-DNA glycosylase [Acidobacteriota bacterium]